LTTAGLPDQATLVRLELRVRDLDAILAYYTGVLGLDEVERDGGRARLAPSGRLFHIDLVHEPDAPLRPYPCRGLYHFALVVPDRPALGAIWRRLIELGEEFEGMSDHLVSEALYIRDPEGNGIELYRDRPRDEWPHLADGRIRMVSDPIDAEGILASAERAAVLHEETRFGHIHFHVRDLEGAEAFFGGRLGLQHTASIPGALFFSVGGYHHHVAANTWAPDVAVPQGATGLLSYTWAVDGGWTGPAELTDPVGAKVLFARS
jgi:catechol 2,3-dioxygenase